MQDLQKTGNKDEKPIKCKVNNENRWSSTFFMLERALKIKENLQSVVQRNLEMLKAFAIDEKQWIILQKLKNVLEPFTCAIKTLLGSKYPTLPEVMIIYKSLLFHIREFREDIQIQSFIDVIINVLTDYFSENHELYITASFLSPKEKNAAILQDEIDATMPEIKKIYKERYANSVQFEAAELQAESYIKKGKFSEILAKAYEGNDLVKSESNEFRNYQEIKSIHQDCLKWWKLESQQYPRLSQMARDFLACCATSVPTESLFSDCKYTCTYRYSMSSETLKKIEFLKSILKFN